MQMFKRAAHGAGCQHRARAERSLACNSFAGRGGFGQGSGLILGPGDMSSAGRGNPRPGRGGPGRPGLILPGQQGPPNMGGQGGKLFIPDEGGASSSGMGNILDDDTSKPVTNLYR